MLYKNISSSITQSSNRHIFVLKYALCYTQKKNNQLEPHCIWWKVGGCDKRIRPEFECCRTTEICKYITVWVSTAV